MIPLLSLDRLPISHHIIRVGDRYVTEHVGVAPYQFGRHRSGHPGDVEPSVLLRDARMERHLKEDVSEFLFEFDSGRACLHGLDDLVSLLEEVDKERPVILLDVPGASILTPQPGHHRNQRSEVALRAAKNGRGVSGRKIVGSDGGRDHHPCTGAGQLEDPSGRWVRYERNV